MDFISSGDLQNWVMAVIENNAKLIAGIYAVLKYFAVSTGEPGKNRIIDLIKK
jgi:hypothetical protein